MPTVRENQISKSIVDCVYVVHNTLGPGLLERVYVGALCIELRKRGHSVRTEVGIEVVYDGVSLEEGYRIDLLVDDLVIVEIKSIDALAPVHFKVVTTYLKLSGRRLALLVNFNVANVGDGIRRIVYRLPEENAASRGPSQADDLSDPLPRLEESSIS